MSAPANTTLIEANYNLQREVERLRGQSEERRLIILAEQGDPAGAPSPDWEPVRSRDGVLSWRNRRSRRRVDAYIDRRSATDVRFIGWRWEAPHPMNTTGGAPTARATMIDADKAEKEGR